METAAIVATIKSTSPMVSDELPNPELVGHSAGKCDDRSGGKAHIRGCATCHRVPLQPSASSQHALLAQALVQPLPEFSRAPKA